MPDWRKPDDYPLTKDLLTGREWAWEFLRRNPKYREEWKRTLSKWEEGPRPLRITTEDIEIPPEGVAELRIHRQEDEFSAIDDPASPIFFIRSREAFQEWGLFPGYVNPDTDKPSFLFPSNIDSEHHVAHTPFVLRGAVSARKLRPHNVLVPFDLRLPLNPQYDAIKDTLASQQQRYFEEHGDKVQNVKRHRDKWPTYLRALDGVSSGASRKEIADVLFPPEEQHPNADPEKKLDDTLRQARNLTEPSGYLRLLAP